MARKLVRTYRLTQEAVTEIDRLAEEKGQTATKVVEDAVLRKERYGDLAMALIDAKRNAEGWTFNRTVEYCVIRQLGPSDVLPEQRKKGQKLAAKRQRKPVTPFTA